MTEMTDFERDFGERLRRYAMPARRQFDPAVIAHAVVGQQPSAWTALADRLSSVRPAMVGTRWASALVLLTLALLVVIAAALLGLGAARPLPARILATDGTLLRALDPDTGDSTILPVAGPEGLRNQVSWSPDRRHIAFTAALETETLWVADADGRNPRPLGSSSAIPFAWSPNGTQIAVSRWKLMTNVNEEVLTVVPIDGTASQEPGPLFWKDSGGPTWSPDGAQIALTSHSGRHAIEVVDVATKVIRAGFGQSGQYGPQWSPDGSLIAYSTGDGMTVDVVDSTGTGHRVLLADRFVYWLGWSPGGRTLAVTDASGARTRISILDTVSGSVQEIAVLSAPADRVEWSPDGTRLAYLTHAHELWVVGRDGTGARLIASSIADFDW